VDPGLAGGHLVGEPLVAPSLEGRLVLFDLDGTLVDSSPGIYASVRAAAASVGLPEPSADQLRAMIGPPLQDGFALVLGVPLPDVDRAVAAYRTHYAAGPVLDVVVHDGIPEMLDALRAAGAVLTVATSKPAPFAVRVLEHTGLLRAFADVHGATFDGAVRHKDQVVGDRSHDVLGAAAHGLPCIGAGWGPAEDGELADAAVVAATPAEVPPAVARL
jgi:phosphoglycolate phosphatase